MQGLVKAEAIWLDNDLTHEIIEGAVIHFVGYLILEIRGVRTIVECRILINCTWLDIEQNLKVLERLTELDAELAYSLELSLLPDILRLASVSEAVSGSIMIFLATRNIFHNRIHVRLCIGLEKLVCCLISEVELLKPEGHLQGPLALLITGKHIIGETFEKM